MFVRSPPIKFLIHWKQHNTTAHKVYKQSLSITSIHISKCSLPYLYWIYYIVQLILFSNLLIEFVLVMFLPHLTNIKLQLAYFVRVFSNSHLPHCLLKLSLNISFLGIICFSIIQQYFQMSHLFCYQWLLSHTVL